MIPASSTRWSLSKATRRLCCDPGVSPLRTAPVRHNAQLQRFELDTPSGPAVADYRITGDVMTIYHTGVPLPAPRPRLWLSFGYAARSTKFAASSSKSCRNVGSCATSSTGAGSIATCLLECRPKWLWTHQKPLAACEVFAASVAHGPSRPSLAAVKAEASAPLGRP